MEDVEKISADKGMLIILILLLLVVGTNAHAAKQGTWGANSVGSIKISVTIPNRIRLFVDNQQHAHACLRMQDFHTRTGFNQYLIRVSENNGLRKRTEHIMLKNIHTNLNSQSHSQCNELEALTMRKVNDQDAKALVLTIVPE